MFDQEHARLKQRPAMFPTNDLLPNRRHVALVRNQCRVERWPKLNAAVLQSNGQFCLRLTLWTTLQNVSLNTWQHISAERISTSKILIAPFDHLPWNVRVRGFQLHLATIDILHLETVNVCDLTRNAP